MSFQIVKSKFPLWASIVLLLILALGFYLDKQNHMLVVQSQPTNVEYKLAGWLEPVTPQIHLKPISPSASAKPINIIEPGAAQARIVLEADAARQAVFRKENSVYEKATSLFEAEPVDVEWASGYEQSLRDMFALHQGLTRVSVNTISCRASMCRIEVFTPRDPDADYFTAMFYNALDNFREGSMKAEASIARRMEQGMTSVYIARKGHTLGFY